MTTEGRTHLAVERSGHAVAPACSPPWVDDNGRQTRPLSFVLADVDCGSCKKTRIFKQRLKHWTEAEQHAHNFVQASRASTHIAPD